MAAAQGWASCSSALLPGSWQHPAEPRVQDTRGHGAHVVRWPHLMSWTPSGNCVQGSGVIRHVELCPPEPGALPSLYLTGLCAAVVMVTPARGAFLTGRSGGDLAGMNPGRTCSPGVSLSFQIPDIVRTLTSFSKARKGWIGMRLNLGHPAQGGSPLSDPSG